LDWACIRIDGAFSDVVPLTLGELADSDQSAAWHTYGFPDSSPDDGKATTGTIASVAAPLGFGGTGVSAIQLFSREAAAGAGGAVRGYSGAPVIVGDQVVGILCAANLNGQTGRAEEGTLYAIPLTALG